MVAEVTPLYVAVRVQAGAGINVAVQVLFATMATVPPAEQSPLQPEKAEPASGMAVKVTAVPLGVVTSYAAEQVEPQLIPDGAEVTVPEPAPALLTVRVAINLQLPLLEGTYDPACGGVAFMASIKQKVA